MKLDFLSSPHRQTDLSIGAIMKMVIFALIPGTVVYVYFFGISILINLSIAIFFACLSEALVLYLRKRPIKPALGDYSAVLTAWLFALAIPPLLPWYLTALGITIAIIFAKQLYGGLGLNPFNPAMVGYVVLLISYPAYMTQWIAPTELATISLSVGDVFSSIFTGNLPNNLSWDAISSATPLDAVKTGLTQNHTIAEIRLNPIFGNFSGVGWEWIAYAYLIGGVWLIYKKIIQWYIPVAIFASMFVFSGIAYAINPETHPFPLFHVFSGGLMLGAFFIATDPTTAPSSPKGKILFGIGVAFFTWVIRTWGGYPDGIAVAVLIMNMASPTNDYFIKPKVFGYQSKK
jgi:electron transport complex protein RnfD